MSCAHKSTKLEEFHKNGKSAYGLRCDECSAWFYDHASVKRRFDEKDRVILDLLASPGVESLLSKKNPTLIGRSLKVVSYWNLRENYAGGQSPTDW